MMTMMMVVVKVCGGLVVVGLAGVGMGMVVYGLLYVIISSFFCQTEGVCYWAIYGYRWVGRV